MKSYSDQIDALQKALDEGTADQTQLEVARSLSMTPNRTAWKTSYKQGSQPSLDRHVANVNRLSAQMDQIVADKQRRAEKAFQGHVSTGAASVRNPAEPTGANPPRNQAQPHSRAGKPKPNKVVNQVLNDGQDWTDTVEQLTGGRERARVQVQHLSGRGNPAAQRPPAKKQYQDEYLNMADQMMGTWPGSKEWGKAWGKGK